MDNQLASHLVEMLAPMLAHQLENEMGGNLDELLASQ
jgi:hypothetical protein